MVKMMVELPKSATIKDLKAVVAERMNIDPTTVLTLAICLMLASLRGNLLQEVLQTSH